MVDMAHDRDDGRAWLELVFRFRGGGFGFGDDFLDLVKTFFLVAFFAFEGEAVDVANFRCNFRFDRLVGSGENAELDQVGHDVERLQAEA